MYRFVRKQQKHMKLAGIADQLLLLEQKHKRSVKSSQLELFQLSFKDI